MQIINWKSLCTLAEVMLVATASLAQGDSLLTILTDELKREFDILSQAEEPAYYIDYRADDIYSLSVSANFGSIMDVSVNHARYCQPTVRVGGYDFDNTHKTGHFGMEGLKAQAIPLNDANQATKQVLWRITNLAYNAAKKKFKRSKKDEDTEIADFSQEEPATYYEPREDISIDTEKWQNIAKRLSSVFISEPDLLSGNVFIDYSKDRKYFVSTEGSSIVQNSRLIQIHVFGEIVNEDKEVVDLYKSFYALTEDALPPLDSMIKETQDLLVKLKALKSAEHAEPYTGPAILHPRASAVFFHEIFGHRIEGHRLKSDDDGQTFKEKVGSKILPEFVNIYTNPALTNYHGIDLNGYYKFDDQGIKGDKVSIVESGVLKNFLMSRSPIEKFPSSNGHGRSQIGTAPVARQSNLIVETTQALSDEALRAQLIQDCKAQGKKYGYYFEDVTGGFTQTSRYSPNAFNIMPTLVYRIYVDGRPDELVKGVDLIGTPLAMFAEVIAAGETNGVFNGTCGAESGNIPVSAVAPSILVRRIETQKKPVKDIKSEKPILTNPQLLNSSGNP